jgi:hypothetical protein
MVRGNHLSGDISSARQGKANPLVSTRRGKKGNVTKKRYCLYLENLKTI